MQAKTHDHLPLVQYDVAGALESAMEVADIIMGANRFLDNLQTDGEPGVRKVSVDTVRGWFREIAMAL
jgi:hypothetical protein